MNIKNWIGWLSLASTLLHLSGCAFAPFSSTYTARSSGSGHVSLDLGSIQGVQYPSFRMNVGVHQNIDIGLQYETLAFGALLKYALINSPNEGPAFSLLGGAGTSGTGKYYFGGIVASYKSKMIEPFAVARYNYVTWPTQDMGDLIGSINAGSGGYFQYTLGLNLWITNGIGVSGEFTSFKLPNETNNNISAYAWHLLFRL